MESTGKETEYNLGYIYVDPKTKKCGIPPRNTEIFVVDNAIEALKSKPRNKQ